MNIMSKINALIIESSDTISELCLLGKKHETDKSPLNPHGHRHPYTAVYNMLFANLKYKPICFGEIGIYQNGSTKCWREFFPNAKIMAYEYLSEFLEQAKTHNLSNVFYHFFNIKDPQSIKVGLQAAGELFDVLLDDSTHEIQDQIRLINIAPKYLKPGGMLIVEDIFLRQSHQAYETEIEQTKKYYSHSTFITTEHKDRYSPGWDNDKMLVLFRNNVDWEYSAN
jgi:hypothetical protein